MRIAAILLGIAILVWLSIEDSDERRALLLAGLLSLLISVIVWARIRGRLKIYWFPIFGALCGLLVPVLAVLLMALKTGLHGHIVPDFTLAQVSAVLQLTPIWVAAGALIGLGITIWYALHS